MVKWPFKGLLVTSNWEIIRSRLESPGMEDFLELDLQVVNEVPAVQRCQRFVSKRWHETYQDLINRLAPKNNCKVGMTILFYYAKHVFRCFLGGGFQDGNLWYFPDQVSSICWFVEVIDHTPVVDRSSRWCFLKPFCRVFSPNFARDEPNLDYVLGTVLWRNQHPPQRFSCFMAFFQYSTLCIKLKSVDDWLFVDLLKTRHLSPVCSISACMQCCERRTLCNVVTFRNPAFDAGERHQVWDFRIPATI